jgi:nicotinamidase-related amidase
MTNKQKLLRNDARRQTLNGSIHSGRHALMLIDFQIDFLADYGRMPVARNQVSPVIAATRIALELARKAADPIIAIGNEFRRSDYLMNLLRRGASIEGSSGSRWDERLPLDGIEYLPKWATSAFVNPALGDWLERNRVSALTLTGLKAGACISVTAREAVRRGFQVRIFYDAVACGSDCSRAAALAKLERHGVVVGSSTDYSVWPISNPVSS